MGLSSGKAKRWVSLQLQYMKTFTFSLCLRLHHHKRFHPTSRSNQAFTATQGNDGVTDSVSHTRWRQLKPSYKRLLGNNSNHTATRVTPPRVTLVAESSRTWSELKTFHANTRKESDSGHVLRGNVQQLLSLIYQLSGALTGGSRLVNNPTLSEHINNTSPLGTLNITLMTKHKFISGPKFV